MAQCRRLGYKQRWVMALLVAICSCATPSDPPVPESGFVEVSDRVGLESGFAEYGPFWADLNADGWLDLIFMNHGDPPSFYINIAGTRFENRFSKSGVKTGDRRYPQEEDRHGGCCGDYDNDGDVDLFLAHGAMRGQTEGIKYDELLNNRGDGRFEDVTLSAGTTNRQGRARTGTWVDYDRDGWLDLHIGHFESPNVLYRNQGDGSFREVTSEVMPAHSGPRTAWSDFDGDGDPDILIAWPLRILLNPGRGAFVDATQRVGLTHHLVPHQAYSVAWGDANNDGEQDLFIGSSDHHGTLLENRQGRFSESLAFSSSKGERGGAAAWGDVDNDGYLDLLWASSRRLRLVLNSGNGSFQQPVDLFRQDREIGLNGSFSLGDYNADGYLDVALNAANRQVLLRNTRSGRSWIQILFRGTTSNRQGFGARVWVQTHPPFPGRATLYREYRGSTGTFRSSGCGPLHVGLGEASSLSLRVRWTSGRESLLSQVAVNQTLEVVEPPNP